MPRRLTIQPTLKPDFCRSHPQEVSKATPAPASKFEALLDAVRKHDTALRKHSGAKDPAHPVRAYLEHLDQMQSVLREVLLDLAEQGPALFGQRLSAFNLKKTWRRELRDTLLELA